MSRTIYCDHNSTTPLDARVAQAMHDAAVADGYNPSSSHRLGQRARARLVDARERIAEFIGAQPAEIVLCGSGSEADNLAVFGSLYSPDARGRHFVTVATEHHALTESAAWAQQQGFDVTILPVDGAGRIDADEFSDALRDDTQIASVMLANNEIGTLLPIAQLANIARRRGVVFHTDAVQALGKVSVNVDSLGVDMLSLSSHKFYGPKGVGLLYVRQGIRLAPIIHGGGQEMRRRAGTENLSGAVGTAAAMHLLAADPDEPARIGQLAEQFRLRLGEQVDDIVFFGDPDHCLPNTVSVGFGGVDGESLAIALDLKGICVSTGSACTSGAREPSHILQAMNVPLHYANGSIRFSFGRLSHQDDPMRIAETVVSEVNRLRAMSPLATRR